MNAIILRKLILVTAIGLFSQIAMAQNDANGLAVKQIADITILDEIIANGELAQGIRDMADTVANIEHSANEEGRGAMEAIQANSQSPDRAKVLAGIIANFSHGASDDSKAQLAELFP